MANQIEVTKTTMPVLIGPQANTLSVSKLAMFVLLVPSDSGTDSSNKQGHVHTQIIRRD
jgi:hypothetical protein